MKLVLMRREPRKRHPWQHLWKTRNDACFCPFCLNLTSFPTFLTLEDKHNIRTLSLNIKFICTRCETSLKSSLFCLFLKLVQIKFIFTDNVRILYIYIYTCMSNFANFFINKSRSYLSIIIDLFCENEFLRTISHQRRSLWCDMLWEVHFKQNIWMKLCL